MPSRALALLLLVPVVLQAQEAPRDTVARAVAAHGGLARLSQVRADRVAMRGHFYVGAVAVPFTNNLSLQLPGQFKSVVEMQAGGKTRTIVHVLDGEQAVVVIDGQTQGGAAHLAKLRQTLALEQALRLAPLLDERAFALQPAGAFSLEGRAVVGVAVQGRGQRGLKLFFDRESARLAATEHVLEDGTVQQARYSEYRDAGGCLRPGKVVVFRAGKKVMEAELVRAERVDRIPLEDFRVK